MLYLILFFIFLFGLTIGSFLNCLIWRLRKGEGMLNRSYCPKCKKQIVWYDNLPILSFVLLRGRCRYCKQKISWQYPAVELITAVLFLISFIVNLQPLIINTFPNFQFSIRQLADNFQLISNFQFLNFSLLTSHFSLLILRDWFLIAVMIIIFVYDLRWYLILDKVVLPACFAVFIFNLLLGFSSQGGFPNWHNLLISGIIGSSFFLFQFIISKGKWIGGGDIRLGLLMGLALGWPNVMLAIFLAYLIGSVVGVGLIISGKKQWGSQVPLGVFLSTATVITLFWGQQILNWYFGLF
ncbi:MAG: prepilin peptidase [Patescibacteria group bacterium]|nr:prepilin peptidase [Patescibacteria group bacterium]